MARKKTRRKRTKRHPRPPLRVLVKKGNDAWQRGQQEDALRSWERAWQKKPSPQLAAALGELFFRRGVSLLIDAENQDGLQSSLVELEKVQTFTPDDGRPLYYMGVAHHLLGELEQAQAFYQRVLEQEPNSRRAAYRIALIALEQRRDPTSSPGWPLLDPHQQADLLAAWQLLGSQRPFRIKSAQMSVQTDSVHPLWAGLSALSGRRPNKREAKAALEQAMEQENEGAPRFRLAQVYLGDLLWPDEPLAAARHWVNAAREGIPKWADRNQAVGAELLARHALESGDLDAALSCARIALDHDPDQSVYQEVMGHVEFHLGNQAAQEDRWDEAVQHWAEAYQLGCREWGLVHNQALGHERLEQWADAASAWREFLRRRPRRADASQRVISAARNPGATSHRLVVLACRTRECSSAVLSPGPRCSAQGRGQCTVATSSWPISWFHTAAGGRPNRPCAKGRETILITSSCFRHWDCSTKNANSASGHKRLGSRSSRSHPSIRSRERIWPNI